MQMTNYEWIKIMSVDELARWMSDCAGCPIAASSDFKCLITESCESCITRWLLQDRYNESKNDEMKEFLDWLKIIEDGSIIEDCTAITIHDIREKIDSIRKNKENYCASKGN